MQIYMRSSAATYLTLSIPLAREHSKSLRKRVVDLALRQVELDRGGGDERGKSERGNGKELERHSGRAGGRFRVALFLPLYTRRECPKTESPQPTLR
jgi:hypothetical protein